MTGTTNGGTNAGKTFVVFGSKEFPANFSLAEANGKNALVLNGVENELISILQGGSNLSLSGNYFKFVGAG